MAKRKWFGTDGIRGVAGVEPLDEKTVERIGWALATQLVAAGHDEPRVLIGRDTRESGPWIERALRRGLAAGGAESISGGILPTPAVAYSTRAGQHGAGVVISASHNPHCDNGLKFFSGDGYKLDDDDELDLEARMERAPEPTSLGSYSPTTPDDDRTRDGYLQFLRDRLPTGISVTGTRIAIDCANGAASHLAPALFRALGAEVHPLACEPDGRNINPPGDDVPYSDLRQVVRDHKAMLGIAYDGDADRCILIDETGDVCDGDDILAIAAVHMKDRQELKHGVVVSTVMANFGLERYFDTLGLKLLRTPVGDRHVLHAMRESEATIGGEQSGHIIFLDQATTGDGLLTSLLLTAMVIDSGRPLSELAAAWTRVPQLLHNVTVRERVDLDTIPELRAAVADVDRALAGRGRLLVRYSGTEPLLRIMVEGPERGELEQIAASLAKLVAKTLG